MLERRIEVQETRCYLLSRAESQYASSYYTDLLRDAICACVELKSAYAYHRARA